MRLTPLNTGWQLKRRDPARTIAADFAAPEGWLPASAPGTVHQDLLAAGRIPDPFIGLNEREVQWVGECDWLYRCIFELPPDLSTTDDTVLRFDGLDTFATVWLNDQQILVSDNMFIPQRISVGSQLQPGLNELRILFESSWRRGLEIQAAHGEMMAWNGDTSRLYIRKAQYHYGWDWGPCLITAGPWRAISLDSYSARIADLYCPAEVAADLSSATLPVYTAIEASPRSNTADLTLRLRLYGPDGAQLSEVKLPLAGDTAQHSFTLDSPQLWWPNGHGAQPLYRLEASVYAGEEEYDRRELRLGLRRLRLVQEPLDGEQGTAFLFEINNRPIFCGGANWIPADSFTPRVTPQDYRTLLQLATSANMVMLRVWGGGIYEEDIFYDLCDELGLLVWQDFMFACGLYPAPDWFQESVRIEAEVAVKRLRNHACLALWCGNNEDYLVARGINAYDPAFQGDFTTSRFPARVIYEQLLPDICATLDPARSYWPGSPYGDADPNGTAIGDRHAWEVWHGNVADYHEYPKFAGRFVSEFGLQAAPARTTIDAFATPSERYPQSRTMDHHNKATDGPRRLAAYMSDNICMPSDLDSYIYATQFVQAEALAMALRSWRRHWSGPKRYTVAGALIWQLNDCWPATSWAIIDSALRPKSAYYAIRRELAPIAVGLARADDSVDVWAINETTETIEAEIELRAWTWMGELLVVEQQSCTLLPHQANELGAFGFDLSRALIFSARLRVGDQIIARATLWPEPFKYHILLDPEIEIVRVAEDTLQLRTLRPAKGVLLTAGDEVVWSDNMLDLLPGDEQIVVAHGLGSAEVQVQRLA